MNPEWHTVKTLYDEIERLSKVNAELVTALKFYADPYDYEGRMVNDGNGYFDTMGFDILDDKGAVAREAIAKVNIK